MAGRPRFLCGVVEGFYGRPWSMEERRLLFRWLERRGLNCYMYAPKDELKHRLLWREPYTEHEAAQMQSLIEAAQEHGVEFIFAISAGQDMVFSSAGDRLLLQQKLRQVAAMGCRAFALLFDDIDPCMCRADRNVFTSLAEAQASVANEAYQELGQPSVFLFCPTASTMPWGSPGSFRTRTGTGCGGANAAFPARVLQLTLLSKPWPVPLPADPWTGAAPSDWGHLDSPCPDAPGPKVVSQELSAMLLEEVEGVLGRRPIIWDNLFANDYDCRRVFLGPYTGRAPGLMPQLCGLLLNPNCELQANFIPIHTLGSWFRSELESCAHPDHAGTETAATLGDSQGPWEGSYSPQEALELALLDWVAEINQHALETGGRALLHPSAGCEGGAGLQPGTAGWQEATPGPQTHDAAPRGADQRSPETCSMTPGEGRRKVTLVPKKDSGSRTPTGSQQSPPADGDQLASASGTSCKPSSAPPSTVGSAQPAGAPVTGETFCSLETPTCCSSGADNSQSPLLDTSNARGGDGNLPQPPGSPQPGADASPVTTTPLTDGAGASPVPTAPLTDGTSDSPVPTTPLTDGVDASSDPMALLTDGTSASPGPTAPLTPEEATSIHMAPLAPEAARSGYMTPRFLEEARSDSNDPLTMEEVRMLVELFYLPYHHGPQAQRLLEHLQWLRANSPSVGVPATAPNSCEGARWRGRAQSFQLLCAQTCHLHSRFVCSAGQALLYDLHPYLWDIRNMLLAASAFILWLDGHLLCDPDPTGNWRSCFGWCQSITAPLFPREDAEPWAHRGGLFGELQALLPVGNSCDLFYHPPPLFPSRQLYLLRPLLPQDKGELYRMCREGLDCDPSVADVLVAHPDLLGDRLLGSFLHLSPEYTFVLEDEGGPCGYAAGALCAEGFLRERASNWLPAMRHKYPRELGVGGPALGQDALEEALLFFHAEPPAVPLPVLRRFPSLVQLGTAPRVLDVGASCSLAVCLLSALRANGSRGVFCQVSATDQQQLSFYSKLGFVALPVPWPSSPGARLLGRLL
ncbi:protein O-GlcNAcase-like isoform X2 [Cygnus atratus]|uniref:protein O-GlcNAcase-like isoform X2 n=1 Tax=Cygnus atratus TaxID=8868 RepID=UPI0015D65909|nr:protein O-GlcNAcase-like isoform X2 [Cygnus atratus]